MAKRVKETRSELQQAADRVRIIQQAVNDTEESLQACQQEVRELELRMMEANRNLSDTYALLAAQKDKLARELNDVRVLTFMAEARPDKEPITFG